MKYCSYSCNPNIKSTFTQKYAVSNISCTYLNYLVLVNVNTYLELRSTTRCASATRSDISNEAEDNVVVQVNASDGTARGLSHPGNLPARPGP